MLLLNIHPKVVSKLLGHSDIRITLELYSYAIPTLQTEAADKIDNLLSNGIVGENQPSTVVADLERTLDL